MLQKDISICIYFSETHRNSETKDILHTVAGQAFGTLWGFLHDGPGEVRRKHNAKVPTSLPGWYRDTIKLVVWLNWRMRTFDEGEDERFCQVEVQPRSGTPAGYIYIGDHGHSGLVFDQVEK